MIVRRARTIEASADAIWRVLADPYHLPRWWPRVQRVEGVRVAGWTAVLGAGGDRAVRADYAVQVSEPGVRRRWRQELEGSPFARILTEAVTDVRLESVGPASTRVVVELVQAPRGWARFGPWMLRRAAREQADEALAALAALVEP